MTGRRSRRCGILTGRVRLSLEPDSPGGTYPMHHLTRTLPLGLLAVLLCLAPALANFTSRDRENVIYAVHQSVPRNARVQIQKVAGNYARVGVSTPDGNRAIVFVRKRAGRWHVIAGP